MSSNVGAALHHIGRYDDALEKYEFTLRQLEKHRPTRLQRLLMGDITEQRIVFLEHRMRLARKHERPRVSEYLSSGGKLKLDGKENWTRAQSAEEDHNRIENRRHHVSPGP